MQSQKVFGTWGRVCLLLLAVAMTPMLAVAQQSITGEIKGSVMDTSQAVVPAVTISIQNVQTGVVTPSTTNGSGLYDVPFLTPGDYTVTFSKQGFRDFIRQGVKLEIETLEINATLQIGSATQEVVVNSAAPLVETETSEQHADLNTAAVAAAPIVGYDWRNALVALSPGINVGAGGAGAANGQAVGVNGTQGYNVGFSIDGANATSPRDFNGSNNIVPVDTISEINISSANAGPEYGSALSTFNATTKSGTNQWHGTFFEYDQNTALNARSFTNQSGPKSTEHYNLYGGTVGGPIIKNKLFFFFAFQYNPSVNPVTALYSYPTTAMEAGNFTGQPLTTENSTNCPGCTTTTIPAGDFSNVAKKLQAFFPAATAPGWKSGCPSSPSCVANNDYNFNSTAKDTNKWYEAKVDYDFNSKQKLTFSFNYFPEFTTNVNPDPLFPNDASAISTATNYNLTGQITETYTISPTALNEFRAGAERELDGYLPYSLGKNDPAMLGLEPAYGLNAPSNQFPSIVIENNAGNGNINLGTEFASQINASGTNGNGNINAVLGEGTYTFSDILTLVRGRHTLKIGGEYDRYYQDYTNWGSTTSGNFGFTGAVTGNAYADFLLGDVEQWSVNESEATSARNWTSAIFVGDDFKVSSKVTLNLGLRWQIQSGWGVTGDLFGNYDPNLPNTAAYVNGVLNPNAKGALLFGGNSDISTGGSIANLNTIQGANYKEFAPRIGIAWSPANNWAIRASYGVFDAPRDAENYTDGALGLGFNPVAQLTGTAAAGSTPGTPAFKLDVGPPAGTFSFPTLATLTPSIDNFNGVEFYPRHEPTSYVSELLFDVQHEFVGGILADVGYVYTRGTNLNFQTDIDQAPQNEFGVSCPTIMQTVNGVSRSVNQNCVGPVPQFNSIVGETYDGWSNYNALQVRLQKRMSNGLDFLVNYAWSKSLDTGTGNGHGSAIDGYQNAYSPAANYSLSNFNAANTITGQVTWELPFGSGRRFAAHGVADEVIGGWRASSVFQWHSGIPFTPLIQGSVADNIDPGLQPSFGAGAPNNGAGSSLFANIIGNPNLSSHPIVPNGNGVDIQWFNPAAFANPANGTFGDASRDSLIGPSFSDVDFSISKDFSLRWEGMKLQIRADMTNLFNHPSFANPDSNVGFSGSSLADSSAGRITSLKSGPRTIQIGAHFSF